MKFKISKSTLNFLLSKFDKKDSDFETIDLEPELETATRAMHEQNIKQRSFHEGYHLGLKEGFYNARYKTCLCGCGGNNCATRFCDKDCRYYNV